MNKRSIIHSPFRNFSSHARHEPLARLNGYSPFKSERI